MLVFVMFRSRNAKQQSTIIREVYTSDPPAGEQLPPKT